MGAALSPSHADITRRDGNAEAISHSTPNSEGAVWGPFNLAVWAVARLVARYHRRGDRVTEGALERGWGA